MGTTTHAAGRRLRAALVALVLMTLAACSPGASAPSSGQDATVRAGLFDRDVEHLEPDDEDLATTRLALVDGHIVDTGSGEVLT